MREGKTDPITPIPNKLNWSVSKSTPFGRYEIQNLEFGFLIENKIDVAVVTSQ